MIVTGKFVYISSKVSEFEGKKYYKVNMEDTVDETINQFGIDEGSLQCMEKYKQYLCNVEIKRGTYEGRDRTTMNIVAVNAIK